jgi:hypothetical protein
VDIDTVAFHPRTMPVIHRVTLLRLEEMPVTRQPG